LADRLASIKGRFKMEEVQLRYTVSGGNGQLAKQLIISG